MIDKINLDKIENARRILNERKLQEIYNNNLENEKRVEKLKTINEQKSGKTQQSKI